MWNDKYLQDIREIKGFLVQGDITNSLEKFKVYIPTLEELGSFNSNNWRQDWRQEIYNFGTFFKTLNPEEFLKCLKELRTLKNEEVLDFIYSEIIWNFFGESNDLVKSELKAFINKYPFNPEFLHSISHSFEISKNFEEALKKIEDALKIEKNNNIFLATYIYKVKSYFDFLITKGKIEEGEKLIETTSEYLKNQNPTLNDFYQRNIINILKDRLNDQKGIDRKVKYFETEISKKIEIEQRRLIEVLGIFSAILGFILTSIQIANSNLSEKSIIKLMICMSLVLLIFAISISFLFGRRDRNQTIGYLICRPKFLAIVLLFLSLLFIYFN